MLVRSTSRDELGAKQRQASMQRVTTCLEPKQQWQELKAFMAAPMEIRFQRKA